MLPINITYHAKAKQTRSENGDTKLPVFGGFWYTWTGDYQYTDPCGLVICNYIDQTFNPKALAERLLPPVPQRYCTWGDVQAHEESVGTPEFVFMFDLNDWQYIFSDPSQPHTINWKRACIDKEQQVRDIKNVYIFPKYICPSDTTYHNFKCSTKPTACKGDVVGRDLNSPPFWTLGHVGITISNTTVMEVLWEKVVLQFNDITDFKNRTKYWGDKYYLPQKPDLTDKEAEQISLAGKKQANYDPEYTWTPYWHPGSDTFLYIYNMNEWQKIYGMTRALFRCDSFVYYCYLAGANVKIVDFDSTTAPMHIYYAFAKQRPNDVQFNYSLTDNHTTAISLNSLINEDKLNIEQLDRTSEYFINSSEHSREKKIHTLWTLAIQQQSTEKFAYLMDAIAILKPLELIPHFIANFKQQTHVDNQLKIIRVISRIMQQLEQPKTLSSTQVNYIEQAQAFFTKLLETSMDAELVREVIICYPLIMPPKVAYENLPDAYLRQQKLASAQPGSIRVTKKDWYKQQLRLAFSTQIMQEKLLIKLLEDAAQLEPADKLGFDITLYLILESMPASWLSHHIVQPLQGYIKQQEQAAILASRKQHKPTSPEEFLVTHLHAMWQAAQTTIAIAIGQSKKNYKPQQVSIPIIDSPQQLAFKQVSDNKQSPSNERYAELQTSSASSMHSTGIIQRAIDYTQGVINGVSHFFQQATAETDNSKAIIIHPDYPMDTPIEGLWDEPEEPIVSNETVVVRAPIIGSYVQPLYAQAVLLQVGYEIGRSIYNWWTGESRREIEREAKEQEAQRLAELKAYGHNPYAKVYLETLYKLDIGFGDEEDFTRVIQQLIQTDEVAFIKLLSLALPDKKRQADKVLAELPEDLRAALWSWSEAAYQAPQAKQYLAQVYLYLEQIKLNTATPKVSKSSYGLFTQAPMPSSVKPKVETLTLGLFKPVIDKPVIPTTTSLLANTTCALTYL